MEKTIVFRSPGEFEVGGRSYPAGDVVGIVPTDAGITITFRNGVSVSAESQPADFYTLRDMCPWAVGVF